MQFEVYESECKERALAVVRSLRALHRRNKIPVPGKDVQLEIRREVYKKALAKSQCPWCGRALSPKIVSLDHQVPLSRGGTGKARTDYNVICRRCNKLKSNMTSEEYGEFRKFMSRMPDVVRKNIELRLLMGASTYAPSKKAEAMSAVPPAAAHPTTSS
jgi:5-methylcytosine-specific restriction endonuclease McrA